MQPVRHRFFATSDVLRGIACLLGPSDLLYLARVRPFRDVALDELFRVCDDIEKFLAVVCTDRSALEAGHEVCAGSPPANDQQFRAARDQVQFWTSRIKTVVYDEVDGSSCVDCIYDAVKELGERNTAPLFPRAVKAIYTVVSARGLRFLTLHMVSSSTLTILQITILGSLSHRALMRVLRGFLALEDLCVETNRASNTRLRLEDYTGMSTNLRVLRIHDSHAITYNPKELEGFLSGYPHLQELPVNPSPDKAADKEPLPSLRCLEALLTQPISPSGYAPYLERFGALLEFEAVTWALPPKRKNCVCYLDFGSSRPSNEMSSVGRYVRHLFPHASIQAESLGIAQL